MILHSLDNRGSIPTGGRDFSFHCHFDIDLPSLLWNGYRTVKGSAYEADGTSPPSADVKNVFSWQRVETGDILLILCNYLRGM
jgi:hypothetical protein